MKIFIWHRIEKCTSSYHSEGGLAVIAESEERALELAKSLEGCAPEESEKPDHAFTIIAESEQVFRFPDSGCC